MDPLDSTRESETGVAIDVAVAALWPLDGRKVDCAMAEGSDGCSSGSVTGFVGISRAVDGRKTEGSAAALDEDDLGMRVELAISEAELAYSGNELAI